MSDARDLVLERVSTADSRPSWVVDEGREEVRELVLRRSASQPRRNSSEIPPPPPTPSGDSSPPNLSGLEAVAMPNLSGEDGGDASMEEADSTEESPAMPPPGSRSVLPTAGHAEPSEETLLERRAFAEAAAELAVARAQTLWDVEGQILDLAVSIAEVLIERELEADPELHQTLARAALRTLGEGEEPVLRVSPDAHSAILTCFGGETLSVDGVRARLKLDPTMEGLGCIAENEHRRVSGTIAERLRTIRRALEDERAQESEGT